MYLYGAGGNAKVIRDIIEACGLEFSGVIDDNPEQDFFMGKPVKHDLDGVEDVIISIGYNRVRKTIAERINDKVKFGVAVHPSCVKSPYAEVGEGSVVMQGTILQSCSKVGRHCIVNSGASIDHDCVIGDYAHISPHSTLCGNVHVGEGTWIGAGSVVIPGIKIGKWSVIGAGSVVVRDIPDGVMAYGNPCRIIKLLE